MMSIRGYKTKKDLKERAIGKEPLAIFVETSAFGAEYKGDGSYPVVGPSPYDRKWYATIVVKDGKVVKVT